MAFSCHDLIEIRPSEFGRGLFAKRSIPANTIICAVTGTELNFADTLRLGERESHAIQIDRDKYILCDPPFLFSNHSCEPNCAVSSDLNYYTISDIEKDEELLWDYSTSMMERHWQMKCACGSVNCRQVIKDFDTLPQMVQQHYINIDIVMPFIQRFYSNGDSSYFSRA